MAKEAITMGNPVAVAFPKFWLLGIMLLCGGWAPQAPAEESVKPGINQPYENADVEYWRGVFERGGREIYDRRFDILAALGLEPGMRVADIGAGTGFFSMLFAEAVGDAGQVYAVDISPEFVQAIEGRAREAGRANVAAVLGRADDATLSEHSLDLAFVCDTYHHFEYPQAMLRSIRQALRPGGEMVVVDFRRVPSESGSWVMGHVRAGEDGVRREIEAAGFALVEDRDFMQTQYYLRFRRTDD